MERMIIEHNSEIQLYLEILQVLLDFMHHNVDNYNGTNINFGEDLTEEKILSLIEENQGITCICFMGGDSDINYLLKLAYFIKYKYEDDIKIAWYSGSNKIYNIFDYVKLGPYKKEFGSLDKKTTNQRLFKSNFSDINNIYWCWEDITYKFWK